MARTFGYTLNIVLHYVGFIVIAARKAHSYPHEDRRDRDSCKFTCQHAKAEQMSWTSADGLRLACTGIRCHAGLEQPFDIGSQTNKVKTHAA